MQVFSCRTAPAGASPNQLLTYTLGVGRRLGWKLCLSRATTTPPHPPGLEPLQSYFCPQGVGELGPSTSKVTVTIARPTTQPCQELAQSTSTTFTAATKPLIQQHQEPPTPTGMPTVTVARPLGRLHHRQTTLISTPAAVKVGHYRQPA